MSALSEAVTVAFFQAHVVNTGEMQQVNEKRSDIIHAIWDACVEAIPCEEKHCQSQRRSFWQAPVVGVVPQDYREKKVQMCKELCTFFSLSGQDAWLETFLSQEESLFGFGDLISNEANIRFAEEDSLRAGFVVFAHMYLTALLLLKALVSLMQKNSLWQTRLFSLSAEVEGVWKDCRLDRIMEEVFCDFQKQMQAIE